jgi:hypothetical protein
MADEMTPQEQAYFDTKGAAENVEEADPVAETPAEPVETAPEAPETPPAEKKDGSWVPIGALHETRAQLKETRAEMETLRKQRMEDESRWATAQQRLNQIQEAMMRAQNPEPAPPSFEDDPVAASRYGLEKTGAAVQQMNDRLRQMEEGQRQQAVEAQLSQMAVAQERQFAEKTQDFQEAVNHLVTNRIQELRYMNYAPQQIREVLEGERRQLMMRTAQTGGNWAETLYSLAKARGYAPKAVPAEKKMEQLKEGQQAAAGLSEVSGRQTVPLSIQSLASMDDDDFYKISSNPKEWAKLMGGS